MALRYWSSSAELLRRRWFVFLAFGLGLVLLGVAAVAMPWAATLATVMVFGWLLFLGGLAEVAGGFLARGSSGMFIDFAMGALTMVAGMTFIGFADVGAAVITIVLAGYFLIAGAFRLYTAYLADFPGRSGAMVAGAVTLLLGVLVLLNWPVSARWLIGIFVGVELICRGAEWIFFALLIRRLLHPAGPQAEATVGWV